jgi:DeoR family suf operon transcriptional repressor
LYRRVGRFDELETTRQTILEILRRRKQATIEELTHLLGLAPATIRRHLDILMRDSLVSVGQVRRVTGRPHYVFSLTEAGEDLFPKNYIRLTNRLIEEIVSLDTDETRGRSGQELADLVFEKMAERMAQTYASRVTGATLEERLEEVVRLLSSEGIIFEWRRGEGGYYLLGYGCPCRRVADAHTEMCSHDQRLLATLLRAQVEPSESAAASEESYCAYWVTEKAAEGAAVT